MTNLEKQHELVKNSLVQFVSAHIPGADFSVVDEIVLSYIISILEEASQDPCFDVEGFVEMMSAYFMEFSSIDQGIICDWIYKLANELLELQKNPDKHSAANLSLNSLSLSDIIPESKLRARNSSSSSEKDEYPESDEYVSGNNGYDINAIYSQEIKILEEMFPDTPLIEIKYCITIANGDIDGATQTILHRQDTGQSLTDKSHTVARKNVVADDTELKNRIIARYSYVDKDSAKREYKPMAPKTEPKKLVRYRDNKIVSLKGERYTEVKRDEEAELKKPKKPIQP
ncbi:CUE domain-containing protein 2-A [Musca domestica]|uniref:CUE domain-containing protein 2-A n=1 Tax=Musca domestica TaxID=7370 RepID=A0A1I8N7B5_MUSDO|nr:CUE domain-containing protein 2-A [Musca domestica]XP_019891974.1 CUE domain-containing protein 2-A [Musca domestica]XP_058982698.1 CUE domain-containing protein 2-A [Musca domestica]XP_058982699.1 CUE domain-containing protein 2-A [Musca domestica]